MFILKKNQLIAKMDALRQNVRGCSEVGEAFIAALVQ